MQELSLLLHFYSTFSLVTLKEGIKYLFCRLKCLKFTNENVTVISYQAVGKSCFI